jgi:hypothetical protein
VASAACAAFSQVPRAHLADDDKKISNLPRWMADV